MLAMFFWAFVVGGLICVVGQLLFDIAKLTPAHTMSLLVVTGAVLGGFSLYEVEGETTLFYILNRLRAYPSVKVTTIARGLGFGDELEYVDEMTITQALINRREVER